MLSLTMKSRLVGQLLHAALLVSLTVLMVAFHCKL